MVQILTTDQLYQELSALGKRARPAIRRALASTAAAYVGELRDKALSGPTTSRTVSARTGALRRGIRFAGVTEDSSGYTARVTADRKYAFVHFGPRGSVTTIRPRNAKFLTIPLAAAMTSSGVAKGSARNGPWGKTVIIPTKRGGNTRAIIYGVRERQSGKNVGKGYGGLVPLFALMKSVQVPARIDPRDFLGFLNTTYRNFLAKGLNETRGKKWLTA